jgi:hypothetical protein
LKPLTSFNETENYSEILVEIAWLQNRGDLQIKLEKLFNSLSGNALECALRLARG